MFWCPAVRVEDVYLRPDWRTGEVRVEVSVVNAGAAAVPVTVECVVTPAAGDAAVGGVRLTGTATPGSSRIDGRLRVGQHRLWALDDPFLYRLTTRVTAGAGGETDERVTRFGFRELRVERGFFRFNGKRIFVKSSHTGNHCPIGAIVPPDNARDLQEGPAVHEGVRVQHGAVHQPRLAHHAKARPVRRDRSAGLRGEPRRLAAGGLAEDG
ncbi:MAG: hypothetical protein HS113_07735 [Verrucomicrobiales bacterium]|nr:hypothetical protein [Verrucomicrobiales bacterium]